MGSVAEDDESDAYDSDTHPMAQMAAVPAAITVERGESIKGSPGSTVVALPADSSSTSLVSPFASGYAPNTAPLDAPSRSDSTSRRQFGDAPTYLEAMSSPSFEDLEAGVPPPRTPPTLRERTSSTIRNLLGRAGRTGSDTRQHIRSGSASSLLLQPQSSRMSTLSSTSGSPGRMSPSIHISSPLPNTAVRASFDLSLLPRAGLSDDQMRYLASDEARNQVGVNLSSPPLGKRRRRSDATLLDDVSPGRSRSGSSISALDIPPAFDETPPAASSPAVSTPHNDCVAESSDSSQTSYPQESHPGEDSHAQSRSAPASATPSFAPTLSIEPPTPVTSSPRADNFAHRPESGPVPNRT